MKRNYQELKVKEAWFILTDLGSLPVAIPYGIASLHTAYKKTDKNRRNVPRL